MEHVAPGGGDCPLCEVVAGRSDPGVLVVACGGVAVFPAKHQWPANPGHLLVVPVDHHVDLHEVPDGLLAPLLGTARRVARAVEACFGASGTSVRVNSGPPGQDVFHAHLHVVGRHAHDGGLHTDSVEVPLAQRLEQAAALRDALAARPSG